MHVWRRQLYAHDWHFFATLQWASCCLLDAKRVGITRVHRIWISFQMAVRIEKKDTASNFVKDCWFSKRKKICKILSGAVRLISAQLIHRTLFRLSWRNIEYQSFANFLFSEHVSLGFKLFPERKAPLKTFRFECREEICRTWGRVELYSSRSFPEGISIVKRTVDEECRAARGLFWIGFGFQFRQATWIFYSIKNRMLFRHVI